MTRRCNLHCGHCYADSHDRDYPGELSTEEGIRLLEDLAAFGVPTVLFSGGEPLTRPDVLELATKAGELGDAHGALDQRDADRCRRRRRRSPRRGSPTSASASTGSGRSTTRSAAARGRSRTPSRASGPRRPPGCAPASASPSTPCNRAQLGAVFSLAEIEKVNRLCVYHLAYAGRGGKMKSHDLTPEETRGVVEEVLRPHRRPRSPRRGHRGPHGRQPGRPSCCCWSGCGAPTPSAPPRSRRCCAGTGATSPAWRSPASTPRGASTPTSSPGTSPPGTCGRRRSPRSGRTRTPFWRPTGSARATSPGAAPSAASSTSATAACACGPSPATGDMRAPDPSCYLTEEEIAA